MFIDAKETPTDHHFHQSDSIALATNDIKHLCQFLSFRGENKSREMKSTRTICIWIGLALCLFKKRIIVQSYLISHISFQPDPYGNFLLPFEF